MVRLRKNVYFIMNNNNNTKRKKKKKKKNLSLSTTEVRSTVCRAGVSETLIGQVKMQPAAYTSRPYWFPCIVKCHGLTAL